MKKLIFILMVGSWFANKQEILNIMDKYNDAFIMKNYHTIVNYFTYPTSINMKNKTITASNKLKFKLIYRKIRGGLPDYYFHSTWDNIDIKIIDESIAILDAQFSRYKKDGSVFYSGSAIYYFRKIDDTWKIFSLTPYNSVENLYDWRKVGES